MREQVEVLKHHADFPAYGVDLAHVIGQLHVIHHNLALLMLFQPVDTADEGGFSRARRAADHDTLTLLHGQVEIFQNMKVAVPFMHAFDTNNVDFRLTLAFGNALAFRCLGGFCHWITHHVL